jgi:hypothetical protein
MSNFTGDLSQPYHPNDVYHYRVVLKPFVATILCFTRRLIPRHQGGTSSPFQSKNFPRCSSFRPQTTSINFSAENSGLNSFSSFTLPQNSLLKSVLTVPGCKLIAIAFSPALVFRWLSKVFVTWLTAAFEARYEYHPPSALSAMLPTRALMLAHTALGGRPFSSSIVVAFFGRKGEKCLSSIMGPRVLTWNVCRALL